MERALGIGLALGSGVINGGAYTVQRLALLRAGRGSHLRSPRWWGGLLLLLLAEAAGGAAYLFLPAGVVVALSSTAPVSNALLARLVTGERRRGRRVAAATASIVAGCVSLAAVAPSAAHVPADGFGARLARPSSVVYQTLALLHAAQVQVRLSLGRPVSLPLLASYAAALSSVTVVWFRPLLSAPWPLALPSLAVVGGTGLLAAAHVEPTGLRRHGQAEWVGVHFVSCLLLFTAASQAVYGDLSLDDDLPRLGLATATALWGVVLLAVP